MASQKSLQNFPWKMARTRYPSLARTRPYGARSLATAADGAGHDPSIHHIERVVQHQVKQRVEEADVDRLPAPRARALVQRGQHRDRTEQASAQVAERNTETNRRAARLPGHAHGPAERLSNDIKGRAVTVLATLTKPRDRAKNDPRILPGKHVVVESQARQHTWPEVLDHDVRVPHQAKEYRPPLLGPKVDAYAPLALIEAEEMVANALDERSRIPGAIAAIRVFDLDYRRAEVSEMSRAIWTGENPGQVQNDNPIQRALVTGRAHCLEAQPS